VAVRRLRVNTTALGVVEQNGVAGKKKKKNVDLTLILLTWRIWCPPTNARKWQMGFNLAFKVLRKCHPIL